MNKKELFIILSLIIILAIGIASESHLAMYLPCFLLIKNYDMSVLALEIFQAHTTVATLGIAVIAILSGSNNDSIYGISVSRFILHIKPKVLKHIWVIIAILLSILLEYYLLTKEFNNLLISIFVITIILLATIIYDVSIIFNGRRYIKEEISLYLKTSNIERKALSFLIEDIISSVNRFDDSRYHEGMILLLDIFKLCKETIRKNDDFRTFWENELSRIFRNSFININQANLESAYSYFNDVYKIIKENSLDKDSFQLWDRLYMEYFKGIFRINDYSEFSIDTFLITRDLLYKTLIINSLAEEIERNNHYVERITTRLYYSYLSNDKFLDNKAIIIRNKKRLYDLIKRDCDVFTDEYKKTLIHREFREYTKILIDNCENEVLNKTFSKTLTDRFYSKQNKEMNNSILAIIIYLFYLVDREDLVTEEIKKSAQKYISGNISLISDFIYSFDDTHLNLLDVKMINDYLDWWELMPEEEVKTAILGECVNAFLIYMVLFIEKDTKTLKNVLQSIVGKNTFGFVNSYTNKSKPKAVDEYKRFISIIFASPINDKAIDEDFLRLENTLLEIYKEYELHEGIDKQLADIDVKRLEVEINSKVIESIHEKIRDFIVPSINEEYKDEYYEFRIDTFTTFIESYMESKVEVFMSQFLIHIIKRMILEKKILFDETDFQDKQALVKLFNLIDNLGFEINTVLGYRDWFYDFEKVDDFNHLIESKKSIKIPKVNNIVLCIDKSKISFGELKCTIKIEDIDFEEFISTLEENEDGEYLYNITNDIFLPFKRYDLENHIKNTRKILKCRIDYKYLFQGEKVGAAIIFKK